MSDKKEEKSPYRSYTVKEVMELENGTFFIQIGDGLFESETGKVAFTKDRAEYYYSVINNGLRDMKENGTPEDQKEAHDSLMNFRILPWRFH